MSLFRAVSRHPRLVLAATLVLLVVGGALSRRLQLRTAFSELLPNDDPGVVALHEPRSAWAT